MERSEITDSELAILAQKGDDAAFEALMRRHMQAMWYFVRQYSKNEEDTEDIVQDAFFKAWKNLKRFDPGRSFKPWLFKIARNTALDQIKKRRSMAFSELDSDEGEAPFAETLEDAEPLAHELFEQAELRAELDEALETLHPDHRAVLIMRYQEGLSFVEIGEILDRPMNTVKSWHRRALHKAQKSLPHRKPR